MQGLLQEAGVIQSKVKDKFRSQPKIASRDSTPNRFNDLQNKVRPKKPPTKKLNTCFSLGSKLKLIKKVEKNKKIEQDEKFTHRSVQTERTDDLCKLYETGVIKYASPNIPKSKITPREKFTIKETAGQGDCNLEDEFENLGKTDII